jgi:hypothetical protein
MQDFFSREKLKPKIDALVFQMNFEQKNKKKLW